MASLAVGGRVDIPFFFQGLPDFDLTELVLFAPVISHGGRFAIFGDEFSRLHFVRFPIEIKNLILGSEKIFRMTMTFQTPGHAVRLGVVNCRHMIDVTVTIGAADSAINVRRMIVKNVIGRAMDLDPLDWFTRLPTCPDRFQFRIVLLNLLMAVHTNLGRRQIRMRRHFNETVTISAIHSQLSDVNIVRKRHRLNRLITDLCIFRSGVIPRGSSQSGHHENPTHRDFKRQPIGPAWEKVRHK